MDLGTYNTSLSRVQKNVKVPEKNLPALGDLHLKRVHLTWLGSEGFPVYPGGHEEEDEGDNREERREGETSK